MTKTSVTALSAEINKNIKKFDLDYPMGSYVPAWKVFRAYSKENLIIAEHVSNTRTWVKTEPSRVLDIGSGDGLVLKKIIEQSEYKPHSIRIVEPNSELLQEARSNLIELCPENSLELIKEDIFSYQAQIAYEGVDLILLIHVLYLLPEESVNKIIQSLPVGLPIIIVTDQNSSLFSDTWKLAAKKYYNRSTQINSFIGSLNNDKYSVNETSFRTYLKNPFYIQREDLQDKLISMISYSEFNEMDVDRKLDIKEIFDKFSEKDLVYCESKCYEIIKLK